MNLIEEFRKQNGGIKVIDRDEEKAMYSHDIGPPRNSERSSSCAQPPFQRNMEST